MTVQTEAVAATPSFSMSIFERYLTVWVLLCIVAGIALGLNGLLTAVLVPLLLPLLLK